MLDSWVRLHNWMRSEAGASLVEYAFLLLLIAVVVMVAVTQVGETTSGTFSKTNDGFN